MIVEVQVLFRAVTIKKQPMITLGINTSDGCCTVLLLKNSKILSYYYDIEPNPAERLCNIINEVMQKAGISYNDISLLAPIAGPGGLMGLRISMATAIGMHNVIKKPIIPINMLELLAFSVKTYNLYTEKSIDKIISITCAKNNNFFYQIFHAKTLNAEKPGIATKNELLANMYKTSRIIVATNKQTKPPSEINKAQIYAEKPLDIMQNINKIVQDKHNNHLKHCTDLMYIRPLYIN
ncbi:tRNA threonylcarbamoyladenosine biosynthesis protein TsaB [Candidatus Xenohaliotis californiensis]|uniref:tRNA threonylcarbamoyladenosine biosynthesis protein TsaB n=1 Tax=Candidatus Xenohaliotis californiensis TaxID=84677 RepID=A0ABM9N8P5_9RICK|nr:tRNA threonylcarbamoyladenosine biosynthesis protein TsaB [Candidatus Xenohaliotis californiensis]